MLFEFDPDKSRLNLGKHGIDFTTAKLLWNDPRRLMIQARSDSEQRNALVARLSGKVWFAVYTIRGSRIRIISVRRARIKEVLEYEKDTK